MGATFHRGARASHYRGLSSRSTGCRRAGSVVVAHGPSCSAACGIFPDQGLNPCSLHWQADSQPLRHQGSPSHFYVYILGLKMVYTVMSNCGGIKIVDGNNYVYGPDRKYGDKQTYWKCEKRGCKARLHTILENDHIAVCKSFGEHRRPSHPLRPKVY